MTINKDIEDENTSDDDKKEIYIKQESEQQQDIQECINDYLETFKDVLFQIDEEIDELDSYQRVMQTKRSIDRLIEILYSQATSEDIDTELGTTKNTLDKLNSIKRIKEKRKERTTEEILSNILLQQQKEKDLVKHLADDISKIKKKIKSSIRGILFSVIAHRMDPHKRAGETDESNKKQANIYGRAAVAGVLGRLLKTFFTAVSSVINEAAKPLNKQETSFAKQVEESRDKEEQKGRGT